MGREGARKAGPFVPFAPPIASRTAELLGASETPGWRNQGPRSLKRSSTADPSEQGAGALRR